MSFKTNIAGMTILLSFLFSPAWAQSYSVSLIPDSLKDEAHAIIREDIEEFTVLSVNSGVEKVKNVITVLDENGAASAILKIPYNKDTKVTIDKLAVYDKDGRKLEKIKKSEIVDIPAYDGMSLYSDFRVKIFKPDYGQYPFTVEYEYEIRRNNLVAYGCWQPLDEYNTSLEHSQLVFIHPSNIEVSKKELNLSRKSTVSTVGTDVVETWDFSHMKAREMEPFAVSLSQRMPRVFLMPLQLVYDKYAGTSHNWKEFGKWISDLYVGRDELALKEKPDIDRLLSGVNDTLQKIKLLYEYMQKHTRYVSIQLGIGGWQPFSAQTVFETGYGDCKTLSNYMHALLRYVGIESYPALVSAGRYIEPIFHDFPNFNQFDHVILCVPLRKDTIWLECTNQSMPFGFLGDFTDDRDVLLISPDGGKFAHTKKYPADDYLRTCRAEFVIDPSGNASCMMHTNYLGLYYDEIFQLLNINAVEQKKWLYQNSSLPSMQLNKYDIKNEKKIIPLAIVDESLNSQNYCSFTGNYMLLPLNLVNFQSPVKKMMKKRLSDILINRSSADYDTLVYTIPSGYKVESIPQGQNINSIFGNYSFSVKVDGNKIIYTRKLMLKQGCFKASAYKDFYDYCLAISKNDNAKAMLVKN